MASIHIGANPGDIAETILLPGDPMRAKFVAENLLQDAVCFNKVRGMLGYTGTYHGKRVSIMGSGMGMGSVGIYVNELVNDFGVKQLIRVGTCGAIREEINVGQVILAMSASGDADANMLYFGGMHYAATADYDLLVKADEAAKRLNVETIKGTIFSTNTFYDNSENRWDRWEKHGVLGVEMESQMLFTLAKRLDVKALSILTVSDNIKTGEASDSQEREQKYMDMMRIGFELA
jgi:purine-nucleoside phosphorylase